MESNSEEQLTLFAGDSPAKTSVLRVNKSAFKANDQAYTGKCLESLASVCHDTQFLKTLQGSLLESRGGGSDNFSMTWPRSGSMQNGIVYRLPNLARTTTEIGSGLLPTPTCSDAKGSPRSRTIYNNKSNLCEVLRVQETDSIYPNPRFVEQMMGFPVGHTDLNS